MCLVQHFILLAASPPLKMLHHHRRHRHHRHHHHRHHRHQGEGVHGARCSLSFEISDVLIINLTFVRLLAEGIHWWNVISSLDAVFISASNE